MAPKGRIRKPAPNVMNAAMSYANWLPLGKNAAPMALAE